MANVRAHLIVSGVVQGVFFRASTRDVASDLGLNGWVRNLDSGEVEAEAEGPEGAVSELIEWCKRGPPHAEVDEVKVDWLTPTGEATGFRVVR